MLKRKQHNKGTDLRSTSAPVPPEDTGLNKRRQDSVVADDKYRTGEELGPQQAKASPIQHNGQYPHKSVPPGHGNNPDLLKYYLAQNYASPANLAREANVSRAAVSGVIHGRTRSERIERLISKSCGRTLQELFPAWYLEHK